MSFLASLPTWLQAILWTSFQASLLALVVLALQPLLRRHVPARWRLMLWLVVLIRFAPLPLPESRLSLFNLLPHDAKPIAADVESRQLQTLTTLEGPVLLADGAVAAPKLPPPHESAFTVTGESVKSAASGSDAVMHAAPVPAPASRIPQGKASSARALESWLYLLGAAAVLFRLAFSTLALRRIIRRAESTTDAALLAALDAAHSTLRIRRPLPLLLTDSLTSPALVGLFRPRLLLPRPIAAMLSADELRLVFLHECAHLRRRDVLLNYALAALAILHWFNPLIWLLLPRIRAERELATDELVLQHTADPAPYGHTLLKLLQSAAVPRLAPAAIGIIETKSSFARRIHMIAAFRKRPAWIAIPATLALAVAAACTLTAPQSNAATATPAPAAPSPAAAPRPEPAASVPLPPGYPAAAQNSVPLPPGYATGSQERSADERLLDAKLKEIVVEKQPLEKILGFIRDNSGVNIVVNWKALETAGVDRNTPITVNLKDVPIRKVLKSVLELAAGGSSQLDYRIEDGVVTISTSDDIFYANARATPARGPVGSRGRGATLQAQAAQAADLQRLQDQVQQLSQANAALANAARQAKQAADFDPVLRTLEQTKLALQQEKAAMTASPRADPAQVKALDARLDVVDQQIEETRAKLDKQSSARDDAIHIRVYDVRDIVGISHNQPGPLTPDQGNAVENLRSLVQNFADPGDKVGVFNGTIIVSATDAEHSKIQQLLNMLTASAADRSSSKSAVPEKSPR